MHKFLVLVPIMQPPPPLTAAPTPPLTKKIYEFSCFELLCIHTFIISRWLFSDFNTKKSLQLRRVGSNLKVGGANMASASEPEKIFWFAPPSKKKMMI